MPLYDYKCGSCSHEFEKFVRLSEYKVDQLCPICGKPSSKIVTKAPPKSETWSPHYAKMIKESREPGEIRQATLNGVEV